MTRTYRIFRAVLAVAGGAAALHLAYTAGFVNGGLAEARAREAAGDQELDEITAWFFGDREEER